MFVMGRTRWATGIANSTRFHDWKCIGVSGTTIHLIEFVALTYWNSYRIPPSAIKIFPKKHYSKIQTSRMLLH